MSLWEGWGRGRFVWPNSHFGRVYAGVVLSVNACVIVRLGEFVYACVCVMSMNACVIVRLSVYLSRVCVCFECECVA